MRQTSFSVIILLVLLGAGAAAWWIGSADDRRVGECRARGVQNTARLARCAKGTDERDAIIGEAFRSRVRSRLGELRASKRSEVDKSQYERLLIEDLFDAAGLDSLEFWYEPSELPAEAVGRQFAVEGAVLSGGSLEEGDVTFSLDIGMAGLDGIEADIESLERAEREFIRKVCASLYIGRAGHRGGCPVVAYGQIRFKSIYDGDWLDPSLGVRDLMIPVFRIEGLEFLEPTIP